MSDDLDDICERLRAISDQLGDLALDRLREAVAEGATKAPADEKRLTRARRSVDKAIALLSQGGVDF
jgi:hypothetical protein